MRSCHDDNIDMSSKNQEIGVKILEDCFKKVSSITSNLIYLTAVYFFQSSKPIASRWQLLEKQILLINWDTGHPFHIFCVSTYWEEPKSVSTSWFVTLYILLPLDFHVFSRGNTYCLHQENIRFLSLVYYLSYKTSWKLLRGISNDDNQAQRHISQLIFFKPYREWALIIDAHFLLVCGSISWRMSLWAWLSWFYLRNLEKSSSQYH